MLATGQRAQAARGGANGRGDGIGVVGRACCSPVDRSASLEVVDRPPSPSYCALSPCAVDQTAHNIRAVNSQIKAFECACCARGQGCAHIFSRQRLSAQPIFMSSYDSAKVSCEQQRLVVSVCSTGVRMQRQVGSKCSGREAEQGGGGACQGEGRALGWWHIKAMRRRHRRGRLTSRRRRSQQASEGA